MRVESLRWALIAAVSGAQVSLVSCAGKSNKDSSGTSAHGGTSGAGGGTGGSEAGTGGTADAGRGMGGAGSGASGRGGAGAQGGAAGSAGAPPVNGGAGSFAGGSAGGAGGTAPGGSAGTSDPGGTGNEGGGANPFPCTDEARWGSTLDACNDSFVHRAYPVDCLIPNHDDSGDGMAEPGDGGVSETRTCHADVDCVSGEFCVASMAGGYCVHPCYEDADCGGGSVCVCNPYQRAMNGVNVELGSCVAADCSVDSDCADGFLCIAPLDPGIGCPRAPSYFACQTPEDQCAGIADCATGEICSATVPRECHPGAACGRPFLVGGVARSAPSIASSSWLDGEVSSVPLEGLDAAARELVARHWLEAGAMEHASVAAFARFALELLSLGAPADLVESATAAMADETRHARLCYGLAARYSGTERGPGPLDVRDALAQCELHAVVARAVLEGCIGETQAALEAAWAADAATDPVVRGVLGGIAADEARHAALAFEFVAWASERDASVRRLVEDTLDRARASAEQDFAATHAESEHLGEEAHGSAAALAAHGVLGPRARADARRAALADVLPAVWGATFARLGGRSAPRRSAPRSQICT